MWPVISVLGSYNVLGELMESATELVKNKSYHEHGLFMEM